MIKRFPLTSDAWTPIVAPIACDYYSVLGEETGPNKTMKRCSDENDANSAYTMYGPYQLTVPPRLGGAYWENKRFPEGSIVTYLKMADNGATGEAIVQFIP